MLSSTSLLFVITCPWFFHVDLAYMEHAKSSVSPYFAVMIPFGLGDFMEASGGLVSDQFCVFIFFCSSVGTALQVLERTIDGTPDPDLELSAMNHCQFHHVLACPALGFVGHHLDLRYGTSCA